MTQLQFNLPLPNKRAIDAALKGGRTVEAAARQLGLAYVVFWAAAYRAGIKLPYRRDMRRAGFVEALRRHPNDRHAQAQFVGLSTRQFRASAILYGLIEKSGHTVNSKENP
jgi:hypothetical protein